MTNDFLKAIEAGSLEDVIAALDRGASPDLVDMHGHPGLPLRMACFRGHNPIAAELLRRGADIDGANNDGPGAPLRLAVRGGQDGTVRFLLERGAKKPPGLNLGLSLEEEAKARIVAEFNQQAASIKPGDSGASAADESFREVLLNPLEFEALFGKAT